MIANVGTRRRADAAFTLLELMVALAIFLIATALVWGSLAQTLKARAILETIELRYQGVRLALGRISRELSMAYLSKNDTPGAVEPRTYLIAERHASSAEISFSYMGHQRLYRDADESDTAVVTYFVESDREDRGKQNLYRRETRRIAPRDERDLGAAYVACEDVVKFELEFWDATKEEWQDEWDTKNADGQPDHLPSKVRIRLVVRDEKGRDTPFVTETQIFLQEPLWFQGGRS